MITSQAGKVCICAVVVVLLPGCEKTGAPQVAAPERPPVVVAPRPAESAVAAGSRQTAKTAAAKRDTELAAAHNREGLRHAGQENYGKAAEEFRKAVELDNLNPEYIYHLALSLSYRKETQDEAIAVHRKAISMKPADPKFLVLNHYNLACTYALQGKTEKAFEHLEKLAALDSRSQFHLIQADKDFDGIRNTPRFKQILEKIAKTRSFEEAEKPKELAKPQEPEK